MKKLLIISLNIFIWQNTNSQVLLQEDFQTSSALPSGWSTSINSQSQGTATISDDIEGPAFKIYNTESANASGYWPVPEFGVNNYFAAANDDHTPCDCDFMNAWLQSPSINIPSAGTYTLGFDYFHDKNFGGGDAIVQISEDNGVSWQYLDTLTFDLSQWQSIVIPLVEYNGSAVLIRFQWSDSGSWTSGFAVDNVVVQSALNNNLMIVKTISSDWNNPNLGLSRWDYSQVLLTQSNNIQATSIIYNGGIDVQQDVYVNYQVSLNGITQSNFTSNTVNITPLDKGTVSGVSSWMPNTTGIVSITSTVASSSSEVGGNNIRGAAQIEITDNVYARDLGIAQAWIGPGMAYEYGNLFDIYANDQVWAIDVAVNFLPGDEGSIIQGKLYEFTGINATTGEPILTDLGSLTAEYSLTSADNNDIGGGNFIHLPFNGPISLNAGKIYLATLITNAAIRTPISGYNNLPSSWLYDNRWGATVGIPMIRLNFDETIGCTNPSACNYNPIAVTDNVTCTYPGSACNDNNPNTSNDVIESNCICAGTTTSISDPNGNNEDSYKGLFYQAVARNVDGSIMANQNLSIRFSLRNSSPTGTIEYQEIQTLLTNDFGLITTQFGTGNPITNTFDAIQWGINAKYLQVEMDANGWQTLGTQQLSAVPYAIRARQVDPSGYKLQAPNGNCYVLQVADDGTITTVQVNCN